MKIESEKLGLATDSNSGISNKEADELGIFILPMPFQCEDKWYYEGVDLDRDEFFRESRNGKVFMTSQPAPEDVMNLWNKALEKYEQILYIPMSSALSGAYATARCLADEEEYKGKVFVVDAGSVSTPMHRLILDAIELINEGYSAEEILSIIEESREKMIIYIGLDTLENLKRGGRISGSSALIGNVLNIKPVMKFSTGLLDIHKKCRGMKNAQQTMLQAIKDKIDNDFKDEFANGEVYIVAASSADEEATANWVNKIKEFFPGVDVLCDPLPISLSCHIGEGGLGIGCACKFKGDKK